MCSGLCMSMYVSVPVSVGGYGSVSVCLYLFAESVDLRSYV